MRNARRLVIVALALLVLIGAGIALLPWLVGAGLGHGLIRARLDEAVSGGADFDAIAASWSGEQVIEGLVLTADDGHTRVDVDVIVRHGLLGLIGGMPPTLDVSVSGTAQGRLDESGRPSFLRLPAGGADAGDAGGGPGGAGDGDGDGEPARLPFGLRVDVDRLVVDLQVPVGGAERLLQLTGVEGDIEIARGAPAMVVLTSPTRFEGADGSLGVDVAVRDLVAADGRLTPLVATIDAARITARDVPVPTGDAEAPVLVRTFDLTADGDPRGRLQATLSMLARVGDAAGDSRLTADVRLDELVRDGAIDVGGATWSIDAEGADVPTGPLDALVPALAGQGVDLSRDLGRTVALRITAGSAAGDAFEVELRGAGATLTSRGTTTEDRRIAIDGATFDGSVHPALVAHHGPMTLDRAVPVRVVAGAFVLDPAAVAEGRLPWPTVTAQSRNDGPITLTMPPSGERAVDAGRDGEGDGDGETGSAATPTTLRLAGFEAVLRPNAAAPSGDDASDAAPADPLATLTVRGVSFAHPAMAVPVASESVVLEAAPRVRAGVGPLLAGAPIDLRLRPSAFTAGGATLATIDGDGTYAADDDGEAATDEEDPPTVVHLRLAGADPAVLERVLALEAGTVAGWTRGAGDVRLTVEPAAPLRARASLAFPGLDGDLAGRRDGDTVDLEATGLTVRPSAERLAALTAREGGDAGDAGLRFTGDVAITATGRVRGLVLERLAGEADGGAAAWLDAFDSLAFDATTTQLAFTAAGTSSTLPPLDVAVARNAPGDPLTLAIRDTASGGTDPETPGSPGSPGTSAPSISADLRLLGLGGEPAAAAVRLDGDVQLRRASSALLDALFGTGDLIASSIGATVDATMTAEGFGRSAGRLVLEAIGSRGRVGGTVRGEDNAFVVDPSAPLVAVLDLHPVLRQRVLSNIQPIFAGVTSTDGPITIRVTSAIVPLSDGASAASAEFETSGGTLFMEPGFDFLSLISLFDGRGQPLEARLEPLSGRLVAGRVITDGARLVFTKGATIDFAAGSSVDLETRTLDVRASMPLQWLGSVIREARTITESITVPLVARGPVSSAELKLDPSFDLGAALLEAGVGGLLERELDRAVPGLGDLLRGLGGNRGGGGDGGGG